MVSPKVFVVTGGNKGIGKSIVKLLLQDKIDKVVYLTSRNEELGQKAVKDLDDSFGLKAKYHQLDITDQNSIEELRDYLVEKYGGLDVLVNNAGIAFRGNSPYHGAVNTVGCNFFGTMNVFETLITKVKDNGCIVYVSSISGSNAFSRLSEGLKTRLSNPSLSINELSRIMNEFIEATQDQDSFERSGWPISSYGISKMGVNLLAQLQQKYLDSNEPERNLRINSCCPGLVETDMTKGKHAKESYLSTDQGAETPVYLALLPSTDTSVRGRFYKSKKCVEFPPT